MKKLLLVLGLGLVLTSCKKPDNVITGCWESVYSNVDSDVIITRYEFSMDISDFGMSYIGEIEKVSKDKIFINKGDYELLVMDYYFKSVRPYNLVIEGLEYKRVSCE